MLIEFFFSLFFLTFFLQIAIIKMYEHRLVEWNPSVEDIRYTSDHLIEFVDSFFDLTALVFVFTHFVCLFRTMFTLLLGLLAGWRGL